MAPDGGAAADTGTSPGTDAGGGTDAGSEETDAGQPCVGTECDAPRVVSVLPADGAVGVPADATIRIEFSEPMDQATVASAVTITSIGAGAVTRSWNPAGTVLTITPMTPLAYATGTSLATPARQYTVTVATTASDLDGTPLAEEANATFSTLRRLSLTLSPAEAAYFSTYGFAMGGMPSLCPTADGLVRVGYHTSISASGTYNSYIRFDLTALGAAGDVEVIESATFRATQTADFGSYYAGGRSVLLHRLPALSMISRDVADSTIVNDTTIAEIGTFTTTALTMPTAEVGASLAAQWAAGDTSSALFRLTRGGSVPSMTSYAQFNCDGFSLTVTYVTR